MDPSQEQGAFSEIKFAVFGLGNKTYDKFNHVGKEIDRRMEELGATRIFSLGLGDDDVNIEKDFLSWKKDLTIALCKENGLKPPNLSLSATISLRRQHMIIYKPDDPVVKDLVVDAIARWRPGPDKHRTTPDMKSPYLATILDTRDLHTSDSERTCIHAELSTHGDLLTYHPGDHLGIFPENDLEIVYKLGEQLGTPLDTIIAVYPIDDVAGKNPIVGPCTLKAALYQYYDITSHVRKAVLKVLAQYTRDEEEKKRLLNLASEEPELQELYEKYIVHDCRVITEIFDDFKSIQVNLDHFLEVLPKMQPRYYSISSSPNETPGRVSLTAVLVEYSTPTKRIAKGVATSWLNTHRADSQKGITQKIPAYIRKSAFKLPPSNTTPIIMVGPGTGLAPFRGFIQERSYRSKKGETLGDAVLFFGCRHPDKDYLYREELEEYSSKGIITHLSLAFSRETDEKVYVQHKMMEGENPKRIWEILSTGGHF